MAIDLALIGVLIILNGAFAGSELALISLREGQLKRIEEGSGSRGRRAAALARDPNRLLATIQVGITLAGFMASATAAVSLAEPLVEPLEFLGDAAEPAAVITVTIVLAFLTLVLGELVPKRLALQRAERWAVLAARPIGTVASVARPVIWLLAKSTDVVVRLLGGRSEIGRQAVTEQEIRDLVAAQGAFSPKQRQIIAGALDIADRELRAVVVPRRDVVSIGAATPVEDAAEILRLSGHSRAPVVDGDLDNVVGVVHIRDLAGQGGRVHEFARPGLALPETLHVLDALRQMQAQRESLVLVTNEYGGIEGIVTIEDLLEELVGEIYDETDRDVRGVQQLADGSLLLPGNFPIHDLEDLNVSLPAGDYTTIGGLVLDRLGRLAEVGDAVEVDRWRIEVRGMDQRAIAQVVLRSRPA